MDSLFPSAKEEEDTTRGGVVLIKLKPPTISSDTFEIQAQVDYDDRDDVHFSSMDKISFTVHGKWLLPFIDI